MTNYIKQTVFILTIALYTPTTANAFLELNLGPTVNGFLKDSAESKKKKKEEAIQLRKGAELAITEAKELSNKAQNLVSQKELQKQEKKVTKLQKLINSNYSSNKKIKRQLEELKAINSEIHTAVKEEERLKALSIANAAGFATIDEYNLAQKAEEDTRFKQDFERKDSIRRSNLKTFFKDYPISVESYLKVTGDELDLNILIEDLNSKNNLATTGLITAMLVAEASNSRVRPNSCTLKNTYLYNKCTLAACIAEEILNTETRQNYAITSEMLTPSIDLKRAPSFYAFKQLPIRALMNDINHCRQDFEKYNNIIKSEKDALAKKEKDALLKEANNAGFSSIARYKRFLASQAKKQKVQKQKRLTSQAKKQKAADEELVGAYSMYIFLKANYEAHKGKELYNVSDQQLANGKEAIKRIESYYKSKKIDTDAAWKKAIKLTKNQISQMHELNAAGALPVTLESLEASSASVLLLIREANKLSGKSNTTIKKDF